jgi:tyrosine-protein phosphatase SIW14
MSTQLRATLALAAIFSAVAWSAHGHARAQMAIAPAGCLTVTVPAPAVQPGTRGIANFAQVTPDLFRGGQPTSEGYRELKQMGVDTVISFRHEKGENDLERRAVEGLGMRFVSLPWHAWDKPTDEEVTRFFTLVAASRPSSKTFVHCQQGRDRTGAMVALYRIAVDHWCPGSAVAEMKAYHYHHFFFPQLETYVENFPQKLASDRSLAASVSSTQR